MEEILILFRNSLTEILMLVPAVLIVLTLHEYAHGLAAYALGDRTAKAYGRLTLNPFSHIDIIGFICMLLAGIGWAKPVPVSPDRFKIKSKKLGMAITAVAGPFANFLITFFCLLIWVYLINFQADSKLLIGLADFLLITAQVSVGLMVFNLIPIPPLDGSKVMFLFLPNKAIEFFYKYEQYIRIGFLILLVTDILDPLIYNGINLVLEGIIPVIIDILNFFLKVGIIK